MSEYALEGPSWVRGRTITYSFATSAEPGTFSDPISAQYQVSIQAAFADWAKIANLGFQEVSTSSNPDIIIGFQDLSTGLEGEIGLTQYGYFDLGGLAQFAPGVTIALEDPTEVPLVDNGRGGYDWQGYGVSLEQIASHEIGHALGLAHSSDPNAVMYPAATPNNATLSPADITGIQSIYGAPSGADVATTDTTLNLSYAQPSDTYFGPVTYLQHQLVYTGLDSLAIDAVLPDTFLHGGAGNDALTVTSGDNVLDGGTGSNFLTGGAGADGGFDVFFLDGRSSQTAWSTIENFHQGDLATLWGFVPGVTKVNWADNQGASGHTGATMHADIRGDGTLVDSLTFSGLSVAQVQAMTTESFGLIGDDSYLLLRS